MYDLGLRIKETRIRRRLSQKELAEKINKSKSAVCGYETNAQIPPLEVLVSIASVLNVSLDYLVGFDEAGSISLRICLNSREILPTCFSMNTQTQPMRPPFYQNNKLPLSKS